MADTKKYTDFTVKEFKLKTADTHDVTIHIEFCGELGFAMLSWSLLL